MTASAPPIGEVIASYGHRLELAEHEAVFHEGDPARHVYVCASGRIRVMVGLPSGRELLIGSKEPGEVFGELSPLDGRPRAATAVASVRSVVFRLDGDEFLARLASEPGAAIEMLRSLVAQVRRANARLRARNAESAFVRTGHALIEMASLAHRHGPDPERIELRLTQDDLAGRTGATRESTARALGRLRRAGVVRTGRGRLIIVDLPALVECVESG